MYNQLLHKKYKELLLSGNFGLEKEHVRVTEQGDIANTPHPYGNKLDNPYITTDFSESQVEMVTPICHSIEEVHHMLENIHDIVASQLKDELLWPGSMPPKIEDEHSINIAKYDDSEEGRAQEGYRRFLAEKYGKKKQLVSGIHYNFSFNDKLLKVMYDRVDEKVPYKDFKSKIYLKVARHFLKNRWLLIYLLGASPTGDESFVDNFYPFATSVRNSHLGYSNKEEIHLRHNTLEEYVEDFKDYLKESTIQYEKELYSSIRLRTKERPFKLEKFLQSGIEYLEVRLLDINALDKVGIRIQDLRFIHLFMLYNLFVEDETYTKEQLKLYAQNSEKVALFGRDPELELLLSSSKTKNIKVWARDLLTAMREMILLLDVGKEWLDAIDAQLTKLDDTTQLPSSKMANAIELRNFHQINVEMAKAYRKQTMKRGYRLKGFEDMELSTQILLRGAIKRGIEYAIVDRQDNFITLTKNGRTQYVKQATKTALDSYITFLIMENKLVSKKVLKDAGVRVPEGADYTSLETALLDYDQYKDKEIVIKPKSTNFGIGITIIKGLKDYGTYEKAVKMAFQEDKSILIEEFIKGKEYRFLVIGNETVGILHRVPANVLGDGVSSIRQLVENKNKDPLRGQGYKTPLEKIKLGKAEELFLKLQDLHFDYVPALNEVVYLRENSNVSTGGDSLDFTDDIAKGYKDIAVQAAKVAGATICGVDIMIEDIKEEPHPNNHAIIEINFNPAIHIHDFPYKGENRKVEDKILELLFY